MSSRYWCAVFVAMGVSPFSSAALPAQQEAREPQTAESVVARLYELVTFPAGTTPDWDQVRSLFIDEAVIVLRTSRTASTVFSVEGFVGDFVRFIEQANVEETGFVERIVRMEPLEFRDIAHVLVLYEASIPGSGRPPQQGVDSFQLIRRDGAWRIASVTNDLPNTEHPVPIPLRR